jgi:ketopantoate reductase
MYVTEVQIMGLGGVGVFLASQLHANDVGVSGFDNRILGKSKRVFDLSFPNSKSQLTLNKYPKINLESDFIIVALKSYSVNETAIESLSKFEGPVLFVQNGFFNLQKIDNRIPMPVFCSLSALECRLENYSLKVRSDVSIISISRQEIQGTELWEKFVSMFTSNFLSVSFRTSIYELTVEKFPRWLVLSAICCIRRKSIREALSEFNLDAIISLLTEIRAITNKSFDVDFDPKVVLGQLFALPDNLLPSSYYDQQVGNESEVELELKNLAVLAVQSGLPFGTITSWLKELQHA